MLAKRWQIIGTETRKILISKLKVLNKVTKRATKKERLIGAHMVVGTYAGATFTLVTQAIYLRFPPPLAAGGGIKRMNLRLLLNGANAHSAANKIHSVNRFWKLSPALPVSRSRRMFPNRHMAQSGVWGGFFPFETF